VGRMRQNLVTAFRTHSTVILGMFAQLTVF
jgi:hypothetical protein